MNFQHAGRVNIVLHVVGVVCLRVLGWTVEGSLPTVPKYVAIVAPHTSNWDFFMALLVSWHYRIKGAWLGKSSIFSWPVLGWFFKKVGGIPVYKGRSQGLVEQAVRVLQDRDELVLVIAPEGTRAKLAHWKSGFYHIALEAKAPIALGYLDFERKVAGFGPSYYLTGDVEEDLSFLEAFYNTVTPRHPERRSPIRFRDMP